jgi:hypothetical protein
MEVVALAVIILFSAQLLMGVVMEAMTLICLKTEMLALVAVVVALQVLTELTQQAAAALYVSDTL